MKANSYVQQYNMKTNYAEALEFFLFLFPYISPACLYKIYLLILLLEMNRYLPSVQFLSELGSTGVSANY